MLIIAGRLLSVVLLIAVFAGCTGLQLTERDCDELSAVALRARIGHTVSGEQLQEWVRQVYQLSATEVLVDVVQPDRLETVEWQRDGTAYRGVIQDTRLSFVRLTYTGRQPSAERIVACLGMPARYRATYESQVDGNQLGLVLLFPAAGVSVDGGQFTSIRQKEPPLVTGAFPIGGLTLVAPGSVEQVLCAIYCGQSRELYERMLRDFNPWPDGWENIVVDTPGIS